MYVEYNEEEELSIEFLMSKFSIMEGGTLANKFLVESIFFQEEKLWFLDFLRIGTLVN